MKLSACVLMAAACFAIHCFADGTNGVSGENQGKKIVPENGPLKELATIVLNTGTKMTLDFKDAMQLGLVSSTNESFEVYELTEGRWIGVSQQRGKTDIIISSWDSDAGDRSVSFYLTSPSSVLEKAVSFGQNGSYQIIPADNKWTQTNFQQQVSFWSEKLGVSKKISDEPKK